MSRPNGRRPDRRSDRRPSETPYSRRNPPPEATGRESKYLESLARSGTPVVVVTLDGERFAGVVEAVDGGAVAVREADGHVARVTRDRIRTIEDGP